jgi:hypothetical protein
MTATDPHAPPAITPDLARDIPTWRAAYSDRTSALMAAFCQLAYISFDPSAPSAAGAPPPADAAANRAELEQRLAEGGFRLVEVFNHEFTQAFLAINPDEFAVLAFRGTANLPDWAINLSGLPTPLPGRPDVRVHSGFLAALEGCREAIARSVRANVPPDLGLYITGHSLGGALAQLASAVLDADNIAACYTYGSPRVGTANFDRQVKCPHYRLVNDWDIVPGVPPPWFAGYRHTGDPRLLKPRYAGQEALRRDRNGVVAFLVDVYAIAVGLLARRFLVIDDHMIWNYRTQLEAIAATRAGPRAVAGPR